MQKTLFFLLACLLCVGKAHAQKEANVWYFGNGMTLHFQQDTTEIRTQGAIQMPWACGSIADKNGDLLFYTDGVTAWNAKHEKIKNADLLKHNGSVLIVPKPEQEGVYFVIGVQVADRLQSEMRKDIIKKGDGTAYTSGEQREVAFWSKKDSILAKDAVLSYSVVDMRKNNGAGEVVQKNVMLMDSCLVDICALRHENRRDFWLVVRQNYSNRYLAYRIDKQGISKTPVVTEIGEREEQIYQDYRGLGSTHRLKGAPNGKKIAYLGNFMFFKSHHLNGVNVEFFDFDNAVGKLSSPHKLKIMRHTSAQGVEFSPNSKQLLISGYKMSPLFKNEESRPVIIHINLTIPHGLEVTKFGEKLFTEYKPQNKEVTFVPAIQSLQLAPNGKIYGFVENYNRFNMVVLHNPNALAKDFKMQFEYPLPSVYMMNLPNCNHLLPDENELSTVFAVGKPFIREILFETNQAILKPEYEKELQDIVSFLLKNPKTNIEISGHTDNEGEESQNKTLSENRAQALANFLIKNKIDKSRIKAVGYGSSKPIADNSSPAGKAKNRRIEFLIR